LAPFHTVGTGPIIEMNDDRPGMLYVLSGTHFFRIQTASWTVEDLGDVGTTVAPNVQPSIAAGSPGAVVCVPPHAYSTTRAPGAAWGQLGGTFPGDASSVAQLDGYFVFTKLSDWTQFFISVLDDPLNYDALDFASLEAFSNAVFRVVTNGTDLWFAGLNGWEIWYDSGAADFPFRRQPAGIIQRTITPNSIAVGDGSVFWMSSDFIVCRSSGYNAQRISTHAIEEILRGYGAASSAVIYSQGGHILYSLNLAAGFGGPARTL